MTAPASQHMFSVQSMLDETSANMFPTTAMTGEATFETDVTSRQEHLVIDDQLLVRINTSGVLQ